MTQYKVSDTGYSSPPCFANALEPGVQGFETVDPIEARDVARWRRAERERLIALRMQLGADEQARLSEEIADEIEQWVTPGPGLLISVYWPYRGEPNLVRRMASWHEAGARIALPKVRAKDTPLEFREWTPRCRMAHGVLRIPYPADGAECVPNVVVAPLVGFDAQCYRLGYGGGYFDRTLAALTARPLAIGIGHPAQQVGSIFPRAHDIPMDIVITGKGRNLERNAAWPKSLA